VNILELWTKYQALAQWSRRGQGTREAVGNQSDQISLWAIACHSQRPTYRGLHSGLRKPKGKKDQFVHQSRAGRPAWLFRGCSNPPGYLKTGGGLHMFAWFTQSPKSCEDIW
jgi:hypothetical protein